MILTCSSFYSTFDGIIVMLCYVMLCYLLYTIFFFHLLFILFDIGFTSISNDTFHFLSFLLEYQLSLPSFISGSLFDGFTF
jgi:hypothetical protein